MTDDEARRLATRIIDTWPTGPRHYIWQETLQPLDPDTALHAYRILRNNITRGAPTPGQYLDTYRAARRALHPPDTTQPTYSTDPISLDQYLDQLRTRARHGDQDAITELHHWQRARHGIGR